MNKNPKKIQCFNNYPEAKMSLGNMKFPVVIKPYECEDKAFWYEANDYSKATQVLYDAFEHTRNGWVSLESF